MGGRVEPPAILLAAPSMEERLEAYEERLTRLHDGLERVLLLAESSRFMDGVGYGGRDGRDAHDQINQIVAELNKVV